MVFLDAPKYPVLKQNPTNADVVANFSLMDWTTWVASTALSLPYGYAAGIKPKIPVPTMYAAGFVGFTGGYLLAYQQSWGRLVGRLPPK